MLEAIDHARAYGLGEARPQLFRCRDVVTGKEENWSLKFMGRNDLELAADWIGALLAHKLGIRTPEVDIAEASQAALDTSTELMDWARCGPAFASREIEEVNTIRTARRAREVVCS